MGLQLDSTGNTVEDISNIIDNLNTQGDSDSISNALNISAYGIIDMIIPNSTGTTTASFLHNLGYTPVFLPKVIAIDGTDVGIPLIPDGYTFGSGSKAQGLYPYSFINAYIDDQNLTIAFTNVPNTPGFIVSGQLSYSFLLFDRPIHG